MTSTVEIITKIAESIHKNNGPALAAERIGEVQAVLDRVLPKYAAALGLTQEEVLAAIEAKRNVTAPNYYQDANFPKMEGVLVFDTPAAFLAAYPSRQYVCPSCRGISGNPYSCDAGTVRDGKTCNWKAYGLFGTMGKGLRVAVKSTFIDSPRVYEIFMPVEAASAQGAENG